MDTSEEDNQDIQPDDEIVSEENAQEKIKKLREALKLAQKEKEEYLTGWQRAKADNVNAKRLADAERKEMIAFSNKNLIEEILPVLASFELAIGNKEAWEKVDKNWRSGVEYIYNQLKKVLSDNGLQEIDPLGKKYDPMEHEAVETVTAKTKDEDGVIVQVFSKGFSLNDKVIASPKVKVGDWKEEN